MTNQLLSRTFLCAFVGLALAVPIAPAEAQEGDPAGAISSLRPRRAGGRQRVKKVLRILRTEPSIKEVQNTAVKHYKLEPSRVHAMARNARLKGLLPHVTVGVDNSISESFTNTKDGLYPILPNPPENPNPDNLKERINSTDDRLGWHVDASFDLSVLLFSGEALDAKSLTTIQENLIREVTTLYYSRRRVLASLIMSPPSDDEEYFYEIMRLEELTATLDAFTGGKFSPKAWDWEKELLK